MTEETSNLLTAVYAVDQVIVELMIALLVGTLTVDESVRFADLFLGAGRLLSQHPGPDPSVAVDELE